MNAKRVFGVILTVLGIIGLIYAGYMGVVASGQTNLRALIVSAVLGAIFFFTGIGLVRSTQDVAK